MSGASDIAAEFADIDITGLSKAAVLAALYNASKTQGLGFLQYTPEPMTEAQAAKWIEKWGLSADYLNGRVMKVELCGNTFSPWLYDRDNGRGAAAAALAPLRAGTGAAS